jgi:glycosyltransferase involved in cell wall biosynthesis
MIVENASVPTDPRVWPECRTLRDAGWDVSVVCPTGARRDTEPYAEIDGVSIHRFPPRPSGGGAAGYVREYADALWRVSRLVGAAAGARPFDVVQACTPPDVMLLAALGQRLRGAATILDHHDLSPELFLARYGRGGLPYRGLLAAERLGFRLADVVLSTNESFRRVALVRGGKRPEDVFVVRNGPDPEVFRPVAPDLALRAGARHVIGFVGLMGRQDGVDVAIRCLAAVDPSRFDWRAVFVGDGEELASMQALAAELGIGDRITWTGFLSDRTRIVEILSSCDVCLSPEPRNPLNEHSTFIKVAEYLSVGRAVACFDLTETRATAGAAAAYAAADTPEALAVVVQDLLASPERIAEMGRLGRGRVTEELGWAASATSLLAAYDRALELRPRRRAR